MSRFEKVVASVKKIWHEKAEADKPSHFHKYIESVPREKFLESVERFGTPQYILHEDRLRERGIFFIETFRKYIPNMKFYYAMKCNDLPYISKTLKDVGFNADAAGMFEMKLALKLGFKDIIFTSPGKDEPEFETVMKNNNRIILNIDNLDELSNLVAYMKSQRYARKIMVSFRVNPDSAITRTWSKYGMDFSQLKTAISRVKKIKNLKFIGLHFHSSWNKTPERYLKKIALLGKFFDENKDVRKIKFLDIGGGYFPEDTAILTKFTFKGELVRLLGEYHEREGEVPQLYFDEKKFSVRKVVVLEEFAREISQQLNKHIFPHNKKLTIFTEPGRFLVTHSTSILLKVIALKNNSVIVDGGVNMVGDYRFEEVSFAPIVNLTRPSFKLRRKTIYGPLCDPSDLWGYSYYGDGIKKGDVLCVLHQGAYTFSVSWRFIKPT
ncbi:MAG: hypothetical protein NDI94_04085, partial [Candidatus Woesearchaeota archaeon]|nr:hypothetical protein [Candidatus Woesearchaeota archaeon]